MNADLVYLNYWKRKELIASCLPKFTVINFWQSEKLSEVEQVIFDCLKNRPSVLDCGAGDLRIKTKFQKLGFAGIYHTQDVGTEFAYTFKSLEEITQKYSAILCLDVIEHLPLPAGLRLIHTLVNLLEAGGILVLQTPNARCVRNPLISDMTHLHCYNLTDLWAYLTALGLKTDGYRVVFAAKPQSWLQKAQGFLPKYIATKILGLDYADNIMVVAHKN